MKDEPTKEIWAFLPIVLALAVCCGGHLLAFGGLGVLAGLISRNATFLVVGLAVVLVGALFYASRRRRGCNLPDADEGGRRSSQHHPDEVIKL